MKAAAACRISNSLVGSSLQVTGGGTFSVGPNVAIFGNLQIQGLPSGPGTNQVCETFVWGNLMFQNSGTGIQIGSAGGCVGNFVVGNLLVQNNSGPSVIDSNIVVGNLNDQTNTGATQVFTNTINNNLQCNGNSHHHRRRKQGPSQTGSMLYLLTSGQMKPQQFCPLR